MNSTPASGEPRVSTLPNGLRVVSEEVAGLVGVTTGVWLGTGSVHERPGTGRQASEYGGMHFLEHVLFKGTTDRDGPALSAAMDHLGADFNAFTAKEHTCFHFQVPAAGAAEAFDVLAAIVATGRCSTSDVDTERGVILDELAARDDDPEDLASEIGFELTLPAHPLGRSVLGTTDEAAAMSAETLRALHRRALDPARIVVAEVGPRRHEEILDDVVTSPLADLEPRPAAQTYPEAAFASPRLRPAAGELVAVRMPGQQVHVCLSALAPSRDNALRPAAHVAAAALGGCVSSRLFHRVRDRLGMAYNVFAGVEQFVPAGVLQVGASAPTGEGPRLMTAIADEILAFAVSPPSRSELERAIAYLKGGIVLAHDEPMSRMLRTGRQLLERGSVGAIADSLARLDAVGVDDVVAAWSQMTGSGWHAVVLGPGRTGRLRRVAAPLEALSVAAGAAG